MALAPRTISALTCIVAAWTVATGTLNASPAQAAERAWAVRVQVDGSVLVSTPVELPANPSASVCYDFGLGKKTFERRWLEENALPICHTEWQQNGIRYRQTVLMTRLGSGDLAPAGKTAPDAVLMIQLVGESLTNEYTEATAAFGMERGGQPLNLELQDGLVYLTGTSPRVLLGGIDIPAGGVAVASGRQLQFSGHMPPGTTGAMTIKIPMLELNEKDAVNRLRDLEFDEEYRRAKRFWTAQPKPGEASAAPVSFLKPTAVP